MPLTGGSSAKYGDRYETLWTIRKLIELLDERAESIFLEPPGVEGEGVEFVLKKKNFKEYHQVKRQRSQSGKWSISALANRSVLSNFYKKTKYDDIKCVFVSIQDAPELRELSDHARSADNFQIFEEEFLTSKALKAAYSNLLNSLQLESNEEKLFFFLEQIEVETNSERTLKSNIESLLEKLVDGNPREVRNELSDFTKENLNSTTTAYELWSYLQKKGYERLDLAKNDSLIRQFRENNSRYLQIIKQGLIPIKFINRDETKQVYEWLEDEDQKGVLLTGDAGSGKSGVIYETITILEDEDIPYLVFRVDRLDPGDVSPKLIAERLGIKYTPHVALDGIAGEKKSVLIIDQLDAVSLASGRLPKLFDSVNEMIQHALAQSSGDMKVLIACRNFDVENDSRIERLKKRESMQHISVSKLSVGRVKDMLLEVEINLERFSEHELELLTLPINLKLFFEIYEANQSGFGFQTTEDLLQRYWDVKQRSVRERSKYKIRFSEIIYKLVDYMSDNQVLNVPEEILDQFDTEPKVLVSENVLNLENSRYSFFHETFFDYAFSRRFLADDETSILDILQSGEQHLFRRVQVRQLLEYLRKKNRKRYLKELDQLIGSKDLREHIRQIIYATLRNIEDPTTEEWDIIKKRLIAESSNLTDSHVWRVLNGANQWICFLEQDHFLSNWLRKNEEELNKRVLNLLNNYKELKPEYVATILEKYLDASELWNQEILNLISRNWETSQSRRLFDIFLKIVLEDVQHIPESVKKDNFFHLLFNLPKYNPEWACEAIGKFLDKYLSKSISEGNPDPFGNEIRKFRNAKTILKDLPEKAPKAFFDWIFPFVQRLVEANKKEGKNKLVGDEIFWTFNNFENSYRFSEKLVACLVKAIKALEKQSYIQFLEIVEKLEGSKYRFINYLLLKAYILGASNIPDRAANYLIEHQYLWSIKDARGSNWLIRELLEKITPKCSEQNFQRLEDFILNYHPEKDILKKAFESNFQLFGRPQFILLKGMDKGRLSDKGKNRFRELKRKFNKEEEPQPRTGATFYSVSPPINNEEAKKMDDVEWLNAILHYDGKENGKDSFGPRKGGARQLSNTLKSRVEEEPERFLKLGVQLNYHVNEVYFEAILRGMAETESDYDIGLLTNYCMHCHNYPDKPFGRWITDPIRSLAKEELPKELIEITKWYALNDPDPDNESWKKKGENDIEYYSGDMYAAGINSVRGTAAITLQHMVYHDKQGNCVEELLPVIKELVNDSILSVRATAASILIALLNHDRNKAVELFLNLCDAKEELLGSRHIERFLYYATKTHFLDLQKVLFRMLNSDLDNVAEAGARQSCLAALDVQEAQSLAEECMNGDEKLRMGAAAIYAANLYQSRYKGFCEEQLVTLFNDSNQNVRKEASKCFRKIEDADFENYTKLIQDYCDSKSFPEESESLVYSLEDSPANIPETIVYLAKSFFNEIEDLEVANMGSDYALTARNLSKLILRAYSRSESENTKSACLDIIDKMFLLNVYQIRDEIQEFERR